MRGLQISIIVGTWILMLAACGVPPAPVMLPPPGKEVYRMATQRMTAVVVSSSDNVDTWAGSRFSRSGAPADADGGSAVPVAPDGYFLTADHVLASSAGRNIFVLYGGGGPLAAHRARVVWRSGATDLALLHAPIATPNYYRWTPSNEWLPQGTPVMHAGISTGFKSSSGRLITPIQPEGPFSSGRRFKYDIPLEPGDSGGAVVDARGLLVGVNSAVEFLVPLETAFFIESEANRPNVSKLMSVIAEDRKKRRR